MPAPGEAAAPRRWYASPWLWTTVVIVVVAGALAVSFLAPSSPVPGDEDVTNFCAAVRVYWEDIPALTSLDLTAPPSTYEKIRGDVARLRESAPPSIRDDTVVVAEGIDQLATRLQELAARRASEPTFATFEDAGKAIEAAGRGRDRSAERFRAYALAACDVDLANPPPPPERLQTITLPPDVAPPQTVAVPSTSPSTTLGPPRPPGT